jgi:hypothetical protein
MAITVSGTSITLNDSSTFATAASTYGAVGSLAAAWVVTTSVSAGQTISGTSLRSATGYGAVGTTQGGNQWTINRSGGPYFQGTNIYQGAPSPDGVAMSAYSSLSGSWRAMDSSLPGVSSQGFSIQSNGESATNDQAGREFLFCRVS